MVRPDAAPPAWRALLFAAIVDDPGDGEERQKLLELVKRLVPEHGGPPPEDALAEARRLIVEATGGDLPTVLDPFCGGGSTLVEAQRLGLPAVGSDLNPVPALITRVLIELVPKVAGRSPLVGDPSELGKIAGGPLDGFLADLRHYAERVRERVRNEIGHLYPPGPNGETVVAWLWARTVTCPNPATAWDAMLTALLAAGLRIVGTWPIHAATSSKQIGLGTNALESVPGSRDRPRASCASYDRKSSAATGSRNSMRVDPTGRCCSTSSSGSRKVARTRRRRCFDGCRRTRRP